MYNDSVSNQFASSLILEELKMKVLQENLTDNQAFDAVFPRYLYIINITTLLLALGHCDGHKEMHSSSLPDS